MIKKLIPGALPTGRLSSGIDAQTIERFGIIGLPIVAGIVVVAIHAAFRWPLKLPGHHGLEWMAVLMFVRGVSPLKYAAALTAAGAAGTALLPVWGFHGAGAAWSYLAAGIIVDGGYRIDWVRRNFIALALLGAFAHASKPLLHWLMMHSFGWRHGSVAGGLTYPYISHLLFGFTGGSVGLLLAKMTRRSLNEEK